MFDPSPEEAAERVGQVESYARTLTEAVASAGLGTISTWSLGWAEWHRQAEVWADEAREELGGIVVRLSPPQGPPTNLVKAGSAARIQGKALDKLRELRTWWSEAEARGVAGLPPAPPDLVDLGLVQVERTALYLGAGAAAIGALALGASSVGRRSNPRRRRRR